MSWWLNRPVASAIRITGDSQIAAALADQIDNEHRWLIDPRIGEGSSGPATRDSTVSTRSSWTSWTFVIDPLPSCTWAQDVVVFPDGISDRSAGPWLSSSLQGRGAFRRFKNELYPELISGWHAMRDARARVRAVEWLVDEWLVDEVAGQRFKDDWNAPTLP